MSVIAYLDLNVECDFCDNKTRQTVVQQEGSIDTIFLARFHSRKDGWDVIDGEDICPDCQSTKRRNLNEQI